MTTTDSANDFLTDEDVYLFGEGTHVRLYDKLGAHLRTENGVTGVHFALWAPNAQSVSVVGDFNYWDRGKTPLKPVASSGLWSGFVPGIGAGERYKFHIHSRENDYRVDKADPFARRAEIAPATASIVHDIDYRWGDGQWMKERGAKNALDQPMSVYECHLGSWRRVVEEDQRSLSYREIAPLLRDHLVETGFTHVELLPITEHPFYGSWGYQVTGYFAPTSRYGEPEDFMYLVDVLHQAGIGVILDWVPAHFPSDQHGLGFFDGTHLFEHADPMRGYHPDWNTLIFNYGRHEVRSFLCSSALFWLDKYHIDGLRVDGVASMLYLDYSRKEGEWIPNEYGGRENIEAITFLRQFNEVIYREYPDVQTIAEESTSWPMVSRPTYLGGLGFGLKWDMGWMHDTLEYFKNEPVHRKYHQDKLTFRAIYAFHENFVLSLSHDEVVHGKGSLIQRMPGDDWQKFANLRLLYGYMYAVPGKKLLFMGDEFAQWAEWNHDDSLHWHLLGADPHAGVQLLVGTLNDLYASVPALHYFDTDPRGFQWGDTTDVEHSILSFLRCGPTREDQVLAVFNFTPVARENYRIGVDEPGLWREFLNTDAVEFGGSGVCNSEPIEAAPVPWHGRTFSLNVTLPPLAGIWLRPGKLRRR